MPTLHHSRHSLLACCLGLAGALATFAEPLDSIEDESPPVEITGALKHPIPVIEAPANVSVITRARIQELNPRDLDELFRLIPGMDVFTIGVHEFETSALGSNSRQFNFRMLVLIDGKPHTNPIFGTTVWRQVPVIIDSIERIEVVKGPASSQYGANAANGVINIVTDAGDPRTRTGKRLRTTVGKREYYSQSVRAAEWRDDWGYTLSLNVWGAHGINPIVDQTGQPVPRFEAHQNEVLKGIGVLDIEKQWGADRRLSFRLSEVDADFQGGGLNLVARDPAFSTLEEKSRVWHLDYFERYRPHRAFTLKLQSNLYLTDSEKGRFSFTALDPRRTDDNRFHEIEAQGRSFLGDSRWIYGGTVRESIHRGQSIDPAQGGEARVTTETLYTQLEHDFDDDTHGFFGLLLYNSSQNGFDYSPKLSIVEELGEGERLRFGLGRSFRAPEGLAYFFNPIRFVPQAGIVQGLSAAARGIFVGALAPLLPVALSSLSASSGGSATFVDAAGNPSPIFGGRLDLGNESLEQIDLGWEKSTDRYRLKLDLWYWTLSDAIVGRGTGDTLALRTDLVPSGNPVVDGILQGAFGRLAGGEAFRFANSPGAITSHGFHWEASRRLSRKFELGFNHTYQEVLDKEGNFVRNPATGEFVQQSPFSPYNKVNVIGRWSPTAHQVITGVLHGEASRYSRSVDNPALTLLPGFMTFDLSYHHIVEEDDLTLNLAIKNLFNDIHHEYVADLEPGFGGFRFDRTWLLTATKQF